MRKVTVHNGDTTIPADLHKTDYSLTWQAPITIQGILWVLNVSKRRALTVRVALGCTTCKKPLAGKQIAETVGNCCLCKHPKVSDKVVYPKWKQAPLVVNLLNEKDGTPLYLDSTPKLSENETLSNLLAKKAGFSEYELLLLWNVFLTTVDELVFDPRQSWWKD